MGLLEAPSESSLSGTRSCTERARGSPYPKVIIIHTHKRKEVHSLHLIAGELRHKDLGYEVHKWSHCEIKLGYKLTVCQVLW